MDVVEYYKEYPGEHPFEFNGEKWEYCWAKYPGGKVDIAVYRYGTDMAYDYYDFQNLLNKNGASAPEKPLAEWKQPTKALMDINEFEQPAVDAAPVTTDEFQDDPTIGELIAQTRQSVGAETSALGLDNTDNEAMMDDMVATHDQEELGRQQMGAPANVYENSMAPEAKEFMGTEKVQAATGDNGLAGSVENAEGIEKTPEAKEIDSLLDRMKELTKIMTNKPDSQWDKAGISSGGVVDAAKEVDPVDVVRAEKTTGAPKIEVLKQELRPDNPIVTKGTPKSDSTSTSSAAPAAEKSEGGESKESAKPWEKNEEKSEAPAEEKEEKKKEDLEESVEDAIEEVTTHHIGASRRDVAGNDPEEEINEDETEDIQGMSDKEIMESDDTELMYEAMVKYKNEPQKFLMFKRRMDELTRERRLNESLSKMRMRF